jgi:hypothetical protein
VRIRASQHEFDLVNAAFAADILRRDEKLQVACEKQEVVQFTGRAEGDVQKLFELDSPGSPATFSNVGRDRIRRASGLTGKPVWFLVGKRPGCPADAQGEGVALLSGRQLSKILHRDATLRTYHLELITYYSTQVSCHVH